MAKKKIEVPEITMEQQNLINGEQEASAKLASCSLGKELNEMRDKLIALSGRVRNGAEYLRNGSIPALDRIKAQALFSDLCDEFSHLSDSYLGVIEDAEISIMGSGNKMRLSVTAEGKTYYFVAARTWDSKDRLEVLPSDLVFLSRVKRLMGTNLTDVHFLSGEQTIEMKKIFTKEPLKDDAMFWLK